MITIRKQTRVSLYIAQLNLRRAAMKRREMTIPRFQWQRVYRLMREGRRLEAFAVHASLARHAEVYLMLRGMHV